MASARIHGVDIYYEEHGAGFPLLLLMGFGDGCGAWSNQIPAFAKPYRTIAFDHRGVGQSEAPAGGYSIPQFADDAWGLLDHLGVGRAHLVGYSMGGRVAQEMAARRPERVAAMVLAASAAKPNPLNVYSLKAGAYLYRTFGPEAAGAFGPLISYTHDYFAGHLDALVARLGRPPENAMPVHAYEGHVRAIEEHDTTPVLARITAPTLVLMGEHEWLNPKADADIMLKGIKGSRLQVLKGGGHGFLWETPDAFNRVVLEFLGEHTP